ncbi:DNA primase [Acinetobacter rathckeae]|uniref:DNA primase n=1 Tax=Acinetobacter rathckeae TaxID=2605272 RepID=UPI0018A2C7CA|nr:CHC2 zinc finger domain-containing protein [Acinetobacter rathckeae]MBF7686862.1 toprim domain-containing protein [Acinetobacter rathckeae]MBF7694734.1 toprim domain-containing protein [Acinetobacter rathckeae]
MAIPQQTIDHILDRVDLVELIGQRVKLKKTGRTYSGCCPFHQEKSPSFHVYQDKQYYHCFGCQANGNAIRFLMDIDSRNFIDVMKDLSNQTGIELPKDNTDQKKLSYKKTNTPAQVVPDSTKPTEEHVTFQPEHDPFAMFSEQYDFDHSEPFIAPDIVEEGNLYDLLENVAQFYQQQLKHSTTAQQYFKQRGLSQSTIDDWRLGYAPEDWQHLDKAFAADIEGLKKVGLIRTSDNGRDFNLLRERVIFPIRDVKGRIVGFGGRALNNDIKPKYINSPDSEIFHKNQLLYGLYEGSKNKAKDWLMVEGYMDVISLSQAGIHGGVATLGTASNTEHLNILFKRNPRLTIAFDGDQAGQKAARRTLEIALPLLEDGRELKFFILPNDHDPDSLIQREGVEHFKSLWQTAPLLSDFLFVLLTQGENITHPEGKSHVMGELKNLTNMLPPKGSYRYLLAQAFREKLGLGRRFTPNNNNDASLSFNIQTKDKDFAIALLISQPFLYKEFEQLRAYIPQEDLLGYILNTLDKVFDHLPEDPDAAVYYLLGATTAVSHEVTTILKTTNIFNLIESPEKALNLAKEYSLSLQEDYLKQKMKRPNSLAESQHLRLKLNELTKQISLKLIQ